LKNRYLISDSRRRPGGVVGRRTGGGPRLLTSRLRRTARKTNWLNTGKRSLLERELDWSGSHSTARGCATAECRAGWSATCRYVTRRQENGASERQHWLTERSRL